MLRSIVAAMNDAASERHCVAPPPFRYGAVVPLQWLVEHGATFTGVRLAARFKASGESVALAPHYDPLEDLYLGVAATRTAQVGVVGRLRARTRRVRGS